MNEVLSTIMVVAYGLVGIFVVAAFFVLHKRYGKKILPKAQPFKKNSTEAFVAETTEGLNTLRELKQAETEYARALVDKKSHEANTEAAIAEKVQYEAQTLAIEANTKRLKAAIEKIKTEIEKQEAATAERKAKAENPGFLKIFFTNLKEGVKKFFQKRQKGIKHFFRNSKKGVKKFGADFGKGVRRSRYIVTTTIFILIAVLMFKFI